VASDAGAGGVVVGHRADDGQVAARVDQLDQPGLARPVRDGAGRDLPEPARRVGRVTAWPHRVDVRVAVQPQDNVGGAVQEAEDVGPAEQGFPAGSGVAVVGQGTGPVMGENNGQTVLVAGADGAPVGPLVARMHLGQPLGQPAGLLAVEASVSPRGLAGGVQCDQPGGRGVVDVVGGAVQPVLRGEPAPAAGAAPAPESPSGSSPATLKSSRTICGSPLTTVSARYGAVEPARSTLPVPSRRSVVSGGRGRLTPRV